jgi:succinate dehydrogenase / fumarate reductase flavoprotein subunit
MSHRCDVLVIGGGGAALRAALAAHETAPQLDILLVTKGALGASGVTATACSDRMAFHATLPTTEPGGPDAWRHHADDIYRIGGQVSDADLAAVLAREAASAFDYLDRLGVPWARQADGRVDQFHTDGSTYARACYTGPYTANHIEAALLARLRQIPIRVLERHMAAELLRDPQGRVSGALLLSQESDQALAISAGAVVLATGGAGQAFAVNVFPPDCTGDGYALAYRAGAELVNLEFIQIGLCSLATGLACSGSMMRALPRLVDETGREFLAGYMPGLSPAERYAILFAKGASWPVSYRESSHVIDIAVAAEIAQGRRVFMDYGRDPQGLELAQLPEAIHAWFAREKGLPLDAGHELATPLARLLAINRPSVDWLAERGVDLQAGDMVEIAPAVQHFQGGIKIRTGAETSAPGLFAAGETAGGQHGANRPGGNALLDAQVFGRIAGVSAAAYAQAQAAAAPPGPEEARRAIESLLRPGGAPAAEAAQAIRASMSAACGVRRTEAGLDQLRRELAALDASGIDRDGVPLWQAIEALNLLQAARMIALAAHRRDESRGPHLRFAGAESLRPIPRDDVGWNRYIVIRQGEGGPVAELREPVRPPQAD